MKPTRPAILLNQNALIALTGISCFFRLAFINGSSVAPTAHWLQFLLFYLGIAALIWGMGHGEPRGNVTLHDYGFSRQEVLLFAVVLVLAFGLRLWELDTKVRAPVDEVLPMTEILALWDDPNLPMIRQFGFISSPSRLFASWQSALAGVVGHNLTALRIPSALVGTFTVGAVYMLGRVLFDRRTALIGALLLATYPPHLHFSRIGLLSIADPLFGTLAVGCTAYAFRTNHRMAWVLGGIALGLTQYFYEGGRLLFPALVMLWIGFKLVRHRDQVRYWRQGLFRFAVTAAVVSAPVYFALAQLNTPLSSRMNTLALSGGDWWAALTAPPGTPLFDWLVRHTIDPFLLFINRPDPTPYYGGNTALILAFMVPLFLLGLLESVRSSGGRLLLLWFALTWAGNLLLVDSALATRYVVVFPAIGLFIALGITRTTTYLPFQARCKVGYAIVAFCVLAQSIYYFGPHLQKFNGQLVQGMDAYDALYRAADLPPGTQIYIVRPPSTVTEAYAQTLLRFLSEDKTVTLVEELTQFDFTLLSETMPSAFFLPANDMETARQLSEHLKLGTPQTTPYGVRDDQAYVLYMTIPNSQPGSGENNQGTADPPQATPRPQWLSTTFTRSELRTWYF